MRAIPNTSVRHIVWPALLLLLSGTGRASGLPNEALVCPPDEPLQDRFRYLRSLSLDLRGDVPEASEVAAIEGLEDVPEATIDAWLGSDAFVAQAVRYHRDLLWNNVSNLQLVNPTSALQVAGGVYWIRNRAARYRGGTVICRDEPAVVLPDGEIATVTEAVDGVTVEREGWVEVSPYWAPDTAIRVCAFDAQDALVSAGGTPCATLDGLQDTGCGCGPELRWCRYGTTVRTILESFAEDLDRRIAALVAEDRPYTDLFTDNRAFVNGPIVHFWRHQTEVPANVRLTPVALNPALLPDLRFTDRDTWVQITLPPSHAGVLTSPAYLLRFQTRRARANRFYNAFLCQPFQAPDGGIELSPEAALEPDLQKRGGCKYCHAVLEPSSSYWGRWTESGAGFLDPATYPSQRDDCRICAETGMACSADCRRYYVVNALSPTQQAWLGWLGAYEFRRQEHMAFVESGPRLLALSTVVDNRLPRCVARRAAEWLLGRGVTGEEEPWIDGLATAFVQSDLSFRTLVKAIVRSDVYRRVR